MTLEVKKCFDLGLKDGNKHWISSTSDFLNSQGEKGPDDAGRATDN